MQLLRIRRSLSSNPRHIAPILAGVSAQTQGGSVLADILKEQVEVLKREIAIEDFDVQIASRPDAEAVFRTFPRPCLLAAPMQDLLAYCMLYVIKFCLRFALLKQFSYESIRRYHPNATPDKLSSAKGMRACKDLFLSDSRCGLTASRRDCFCFVVRLAITNAAAASTPQVYMDGAASAIARVRLGNGSQSPFFTTGCPL